MKAFTKFFLGAVVVLILVVISLRLSGNGYLIKGVWATYLHGEKSATIDDARFFDTRVVAAGTPQPWYTSRHYNKKTLSTPIQNMLEQTRSVAFLVIKNDSIQYEQYWDGYSDTSHTNLFSSTKSIVTMLAQCAIQDGLIAGWDAQVIDYLPKLQGEFADELTFRHLSTMTAGLDFDEHYTDPFCITAQMYYTNDVWDLMLEKVPVVRKPGTQFEYQSGATQILGMALIKATGKHLSDYASEKLWKPLGAERDAYWHIDDNMGTEMAYCCFNTNARDFARFGKMMLHHGNVNGIQVLDSSFYALASEPYRVPYYAHGFWIDNEAPTKVFYQRGILGQYCVVVPEKNMVIVRMGHERIKQEGEHHTEDFKAYLAETLKLF
jgi:CubicO group peptidase (beta-lactamase class C family)